MTADLQNMRETPRNRSLADHCGIPSAVAHAAGKVNRRRSDRLACKEWMAYWPVFA
jgi:hypothetical protein